MSLIKNAPHLSHFQVIHAITGVVYSCVGAARATFILDIAGVFPNPCLCRLSLAASSLSPSIVAVPNPACPYNSCRSTNEPQ